jgi:4-hydroxy-2-oxoheptanedioate aldolase
MYPMRKSRVLAKLRAGRTAVCVKANLADPRVVELMAMVGFDCIWLCKEHVPTDWDTLENQVRAARLHDADTLVRVARGSYSDYVLPLEADATGIMVPHVMNADEARAVVRMTRFMPVGRRPIDGGNVDGRFCLTPAREYIEHANREKFVMVQIEDPEALEQADAICAVPGIDVVFFGPGDFSHAIGRIGETGHPEVVRARRAVAEACARHGRWAGTPASPATIGDLQREGYRFFSVGADVIAVSEYFTRIRDQLRAAGVLD